MQELRRNRIPDLNKIFSTSPAHVDDRDDATYREILSRIAQFRVNRFTSLSDAGEPRCINLANV